MGVPKPPIFLTVYRPTLCVLLLVCPVEFAYFQAPEIFHGFYKLLPFKMKNKGRAISEYRPDLAYAV
jgi:hypothetical protein